MEQSATKIKAAVTGCLGFLTALWGWFGWVVIIWFAAMFVDWIVGTWIANKNQEWSSQRSREGIRHKGAMGLVVLVAAGLDLVLGLIINNFSAVQFPVTYSVLFCPLVVVWYIITEMGSIIENAAILGAPVPPFLKKCLAILNAKVEKAGEAAADTIGKENDESE